MLKRLYYGNKKISFYKLDVIVWDLEFSFTLKDCLFGGIKLAKNADQVNAYIVVVIMLGSVCVQNFY